MTGRASEVPAQACESRDSTRLPAICLLTQQVDVLVDGVALDGGEAQLLDELLTEVLDVDLGRTDLQGLRLGGLEVLLLTNIGH
jgi:hypothetical protein